MNDLNKLLEYACKQLDRMDEMFRVPEIVRDVEQRVIDASGEAMAQKAQLIRFEISAQEMIALENNLDHLVKLGVAEPRNPKLHLKNELQMYTFWEQPVKICVGR
jgi:hypothetical protein